MILFIISFIFLLAHCIIFYVTENECKLCIAYSNFFDFLKSKLKKSKNTNQLKNKFLKKDNFKSDYQKKKNNNEKSKLNYHLKNLEFILNFELYLTKNNIHTLSHINLNEFYKLKEEAQLKVLESTKKCNSLA